MIALLCAFVHARLGFYPPQVVNMYMKILMKRNREAIASGRSVPK